MRKMKRALLVVDVQNDFCPGGALSVRQGDKVIPALNKYIKLFSERELPVFFTRDWHPRKTVHFKKFGGVWPVHCLRNTKGGAFHSKLKIPKGAIIISKGMDPNQDSYSAFQAKDARGRGLSVLIRSLGIKELFIGGLATDYCVKFTALDALKKGLKITVLTDAIRGVNLKPKDSQDALAEMARRGAKMLKGVKIREALK